MGAGAEPATRSQHRRFLKHHMAGGEGRVGRWVGEWARSTFEILEANWEGTRRIGLIIRLRCISHASEEIHGDCYSAIANNLCRSMHIDRQHR